MNFKQKLDSLAMQSLEHFKVPGVAIGIIVDNQVWLTQGYGTRELVEKLPVTEETLFSIGSCTKAFSSLILAQLSEKGLLDLNDPVKKHLPEFKLFDEARTAEVTILDILSHRTGISRQDAIVFYSESEKSSATKLDILNALQYLEPVCKLREQFQYNNFMYTVSALIVERITGKPWEQAIEMDIFKPLNMPSSLISVDAMKKSKDFAVPYAELEGSIEQIPIYDMACINAAGGIQSNVVDLTKWLLLQLDDQYRCKTKILDQTMLQKMHSIHIRCPRPENPEENFRLGYGLGWMIETYRGNTLIGHGGAMDGYFSEVVMEPNKKIGLVILTNGSNGMHVISALKKSILDHFLELEAIDWLKKEQENYSKAKQSLKLKNDSIPMGANSIGAKNVSTDLYIGNFHNPAYGMVQIYSKNNQLFAFLQDTHVLMQPITEDRFTIRYQRSAHFAIDPNIDVTFSKKEDGTFQDLSIAFEEFREAKPVVFERVG